MALESIRIGMYMCHFISYCYLTAIATQEVGQTCHSVLIVLHSFDVLTSSGSQKSSVSGLQQNCRYNAIAQNTI